MSDNVNIIVQDTINEIIVNSAVTVETIDINVQVAVDEVTIIANPNEYIINVNRIIGEQVQSDWDQADDQAPDYIKNKPIIPAAVTKTSDLINDGEDGINPFITSADIIPQVNSDWNATSGVAEILNKPFIPSIEGLATIVYVDQQDALKVDKVLGYGLSENDFTNTLKTKLDGIEAGAEVNVNADWDAISGDAFILNKPFIASKTSDLLNDGSDGINPFITLADVPVIGLTSVGLSMPVAFNVANSPLTSDGTIAVTGAGLASQYIRGDGQLATLPAGGGGGGSSVFYYLNGSMDASVATYKQMDNTPVIGGGTDFNLVGNGLIAQFLTDIGNPNRIQIPGGAWNFEMFFNMSSVGGNTKFYVELLKYNGATFTSIASNITVPEEITGGTNTDLYLTSIAVPETVLLTTDRLAIRVYIVDNSGGRTATLHTEDNTLCQVTTTFSGGVTSLNGISENTQYLAVGTSGTDFNISSLLNTHTFNLPTASSTRRGALSITDWNTFNNKQNTITLTTTGSSGASTFISNLLNIPTYTLNGLGGVPTSRTLTVNGTTFDLSANRTFSVGTVTSVAALTIGTTGTDLSSTVANGTTTPVITLNVPTASAINRGVLSSIDWNTFNAAYNDKINSATITGNDIKTLTLNQQDGGVITANFSIYDSMEIFYNVSTLQDRTIADGGTFEAKKCLFNQLSNLNNI
jgi:hypothetical protein